MNILMTNKERINIREKRKRRSEKYQKQASKIFKKIGETRKRKGIWQSGGESIKVKK